MGSPAPSPPHPQAVAASIRAIATHLPARTLDNAELSLAFPEWTPEKIASKLGIRERRIAGPDETASDLAFEAGSKLLRTDPTLAERVDFLIFCTQAPDYILPTTACVLQDRLGLRKDIGALDINLGCSGYVYGLSLAAGLISAGAARCVVLLTADTYSKFIHPQDRSVRTLFGDGAAATLIEAAGGGQVGPFTFGTDGSGANSLIVPSGGARLARSESTGVSKTDAAGNTRSLDHLAMNGAGVMSFTLREVPRMCKRMEQITGVALANYDLVLAHQANKFMLDALQSRLGLPDEKFPRYYELVGNTVSSSIPFLIADLLERDAIQRGDRMLLLGFGVGLSWAAGSLIW